MTMKRWLTLVVAASLLCGGVAQAQVARSQFNGTVTDSAGGVLVGATVIATNVETNVESKATTTDAGVYVIPYLANGLYKVRVEAAGFRPAQADQVTLRAAQTLTLDFKLNVDAITEAVTVSAPVIETSTAEIGHYVSSKEYQTWPIAVGDGQRQVQQFIFSSLPGSTGGTFEGAINGGRNYSHEILIEGIPLGRNLQGGSNNEMSPPTEMVGEFKLQTGTLGAEFGGGQTAVANFVVKSGTNDFHGSGASTCRIRRWTRGRSTPRRSIRTFRSGRRRTGRSPWAARSCCRNTTAGTAASSMPRSRRPMRKTRPRPRSARCRRASSRTAISRACSIRVTPATRVPGRRSALMLSGAPCDSARSTIRARRASSTAG